MRLIDVDEFIGYLGLDCENSREDNIGEIVTLEDFDRQETAYDVEKVIERLMCESINCHILTDRAIEIVKSGGVDNDTH